MTNWQDAEADGLIPTIEERLAAVRRGVLLCWSDNPALYAPRNREPQPDAPDTVRPRTRARPPAKRAAS